MAGRGLSVGVGKSIVTGRSTIERNMAEMSKILNEVRRLAQDRAEWLNFVCAYASREVESEGKL